MEKGKLYQIMLAEGNIFCLGGHLGGTREEMVHQELCEFKQLTQDAGRAVLPGCVQRAPEW